MVSGVLILTGATASGKTELALELAERHDAEIVGADSRQIYRGMPIGTAAPTDAQRARVRHHLVGFLEPYARYSAARFVTDAIAAIADIHARGRRAIVVGGTGFYIRALCGDVGLSAERDDVLRARLAEEARVHPADVLHAWLATRDPARARELSPNDGYRVTRALEIALAPRPAAVDETFSLRAQRIPYRKIWLEIDVETLNERIARRTDAMLAAGFVEEAEHIGADAVAANAVGYADAVAFTRGWLTEDELRTRLARATRRYAKRQRTWFRAEPELTEAAPQLGALDDVARTLPGWLGSAK